MGDCRQFAEVARLHGCYGRTSKTRRNREMLVLDKGIVPCQGLSGYFPHITTLNAVRVI